MLYPQYQKEDPEIVSSLKCERCLRKVFEHIFVVEVDPVQCVIVEFDNVFDWSLGCFTFDRIGHVV